MLKHRYQAIGGAFLLAAVGCLTYGLETPVKAEALASVGTIQVGRDTVIHTLAASGTVVSNQSVSLQYSGAPTTVSTVSVQVGQAVKAGQHLATMANGATLNAPFAGRVVASTLESGDLVPATTSAASASTPSTSSQAHFGFRGRSAGTPSTQAVVAAGSPLSITLANVKQISVEAQVSEADIHAVRVGEKVTMDVAGEPGYVYHGVVSAISEVPGATSQSGSVGVTYPVSVTLPAAAGQPRPWLGMSVALEIDTASASGMVVPVDAVHPLGSGWGVRLGSGERMAVRLGLASTNRVVVTQGLAPGESILAPSSATVQKVVTVEVLPSFSGFAGGTGRFGGFGGGFGGLQP